MLVASDIFIPLYFVLKNARLVLNAKCEIVVLTPVIVLVILKQI